MKKKQKQDVAFDQDDARNLVEAIFNDEEGCNEEVYDLLAKLVDAYELPTSLYADADATDGRYRYTDHDSEELFDRTDDDNEEYEDVD